MPISVKCPECEAPYKVPDEAAGKAIKCKKCGAKVPIPAAGGGGDENDFASLGDKGDGGGDAKEKKKGGSGKTLLIVGIILLLLTCCVCIPGISAGAWWFFKPLAVEDGKEIKIDKKDKKASLERKDPLAPREPRVTALPWHAESQDRWHEVGIAPLVSLQLRRPQFDAEARLDVRALALQ